MINKWIDQIKCNALKSRYTILGLESYSKVLVTDGQRDRQTSVLSCLKPFVFVKISPLICHDQILYCRETIHIPTTIHCVKTTFTNNPSCQTFLCQYKQVCAVHLWLDFLFELIQIYLWAIFYWIFFECFLSSAIS